MFTALKKMLSSPNEEPIRVLGSEAFGVTMTIEELRAAFINADSNPAIRAMGQIALAMREQCVAQASMASVAEKNGMAAFNMGGGNIAAEFAMTISNLSHGICGDSIKEIFKEQA
jgi:pyruvate dehydrogenase complex dehydrogenase (E1) component